LPQTRFAKDINLRSCSQISDQTLEKLAGTVGSQLTSLDIACRSAMKSTALLQKVASQLRTLNLHLEFGLSHLAGYLQLTLAFQF